MNPYMEYLPPVTPQPSAPGLPMHGALKFHGAVAVNYDSKRESTDKWRVEQRVIEEMLSDLPAGTTVLDCPIGTGRFCKFFFERGFKFLGVDIQGDMLVQSALKCGVSPEDIQQWIAMSKQRGAILPVTIDTDRAELAQGDILNTGLPDKCVDVALNIRVTRWMIQEHGPQGIVRMLQEMQRIARSRIILTARVEHNTWAVTTDLIKSALDGWTIHRNEAGYELAYRIIELRPTA